MPRLRVSRVDEAQGIMVGMEQGEEMVDVHDGVEYTWSLVSRDNNPSANSQAAGTTSYYGSHGAKGRGRLEIKSFEVTFHKKHKDKALNSYLPFVVATAKAMKDQHRNLKMHMIEYDAWTAVDLRHPSTFDTLAMDKKLLYGPPGTGKSSLIAAMANYLKFDIYDLELTEVKCNSDLRRLLVGMSNRSILVVEDIDCSIELQLRDEGEKRAKSSSMLMEFY
uniref:BCS1 n=1 Tax=Arundo donax TaxID=35708 RepID=A0A0A9D4K2_ARUDO